MKIVFILSSLFIWLVLYYFVYKKSKSVVNIFTPLIFMIVPQYFIFEFFHEYYVGSSYSNLSYLFIYLCYTASFLFLFIGYFFPLKLKEIPNHEAAPINYDKYLIFSIFLTVIAFYSFLPIMREFKEYLFTPRIIYERTRTGYGMSFFLSILFSQLAVFLGFYTTSKYRFLSIAIILINLVLIYFHGNKSPLLTVAINYIIYQRYVLNKIISIKTFFIFSAVVSFLIAFIFVFTFGIDFKSAILVMAGYSDYTRNFALLIDSGYEPQFGRLLLESEFFSRIPRAIYPDKPVDFGYFELARRFYSESFYNNQGVPSFGLGDFYADFGFFSIVIISVTYFIKGLLLKVTVHILKTNRNIYYFIPFAFLCGANLLPIGFGWLFFEHCVLALILYFFLNVRLKTK